MTISRQAVLRLIWWPCSGPSSWLRFCWPRQRPGRLWEITSHHIWDDLICTSIAALLFQQEATPEPRVLGLGKWHKEAKAVFLISDVWPHPVECNLEPLLGSRWALSPAHRMSERTNVFAHSPLGKAAFDWCGNKEETFERSVWGRRAFIEEGPLTDSVIQLCS